MAAPRPAGLAWGSLFHHFYERAVGRYSRQASLLSHGRTSSLLTTDVVSCCLAHGLYKPSHGQPQMPSCGQFQCCQTYCPNRSNGRGRKILRVSEFFRLYSPSKADGWRQGSTYGSRSQGIQGSTYVPFSLSGSRWTMTWVAGPKACLIFCSMAVAWRWAS